MKTFIFLFVAAFLLLFTSIPAEANHKIYNCGAYGGVGVSNQSIFARENRCPNNGAQLPQVRNDKASSSQGYYCCMRPEASARLDADYNRDHPSGGTPTPQPAVTNPTTPRPAATPAPGGAPATSATTCAAPNTCVNSSTGCVSGQFDVSSSTPCSEPGRVCCSTTNPAGAGGGNGNVTQNSTPININLSNPLRYDNVEGVLTSVMNGLKGIVVVLALLMIVIGAIMYILSFGQPDNIKRAKNIIFAALVGLAIVIAAPAFLREISVLLGWNNAPAIEGGTSLTLTQIARNILNFLLSIIGTLALIMLVVSGIMYLTSAGNESRMKQARAIFTASLIGIGVALASLVLVTTVARFFT